MRNQGNVPSFVDHVLFIINAEPEYVSERVVTVIATMNECDLVFQACDARSCPPSTLE